jgi:hypothetical protein
VLGPGSDGYHEDHFHLDLARHDAAGDRAYCRPLPQKVPNGPPPPRYEPQPHYYPPEISQVPQQPYPQAYPPQTYPQQGYPYPPQPTYNNPPVRYPQQQPVQPGYDPYAVGSPLSFAPQRQWPVARVPTPYTGSIDGALDH